jgi:hypothetical protein
VSGCFTGTLLLRGTTPERPDPPTVSLTPRIGRLFQASRGWTVFLDHASRHQGAFVFGNDDFVGAELRIALA